MQWIRRFLLILLVLGLLVGGFSLYVEWQTYRPEASAWSEASQRPDVAVQEHRNHWSLIPQHVDAEQPAMIFYPGGLVDPASYLAKWGEVAVQLRTPIFILRVPFNAAIFRVNAARAIRERYDLESYWVGGHSLGGIAAGRFIAASEPATYGLFLLGSYADRDLTDFPGRVLSVMGDRDQVINRSNYLASQKNLPAQAEIYDVPGLNHADFGNYGAQKGDGDSQLSHAEVIQLLVELLHR